MRLNNLNCLLHPMVVGRVQHHNHNLRHCHHCPPHNHHYYQNVFCNGGDADSDIFMTICASSTTRKNNNQCQFVSLRNVYSFCDEQKIRTAVTQSFQYAPISKSKIRSKKSQQQQKDLWLGKMSNKNDPP